MQKTGPLDKSGIWGNTQGYRLSRPARESLNRPSIFAKVFNRPRRPGFRGNDTHFYPCFRQSLHLFMYENPVYGIVIYWIHMGQDEHFQNFTTPFLWRFKNAKAKAKRNHCVLKPIMELELTLAKKKATKDTSRASEIIMLRGCSYFCVNGYCSFRKPPFEFDCKKAQGSIPVLYWLGPFLRCVVQGQI